jgi:hypothetical protein
VLFGGVPVEERRLRQLLQVVPPIVARRLETALFYRAAVLGLTAPERRAILAALENPPAGLENLRATLIQDPAWREPERRYAPVVLPGGSAASSGVPPTAREVLPPADQHLERVARVQAG